MTIPASLGYTVQVRRGIRGWSWSIRLGGTHAYGKVHAQGVADTPEKALQDAAVELRGTHA